MRVVVLGAGAVGGLLAGRFVRAGHSVLLIGRPGVVAAVRSQGLRLVGITEGTFRPDVGVDLQGVSRPDLVFLTVKAPSLRAAAEEIGRAFPDPVPVVALPNGLGVERPILDGLRAAGWRSPEEWVLRAVNSYGAFVESPGAIRHAGEGEILLPEDPTPVPQSARDAAQTLLISAGLTVRRVEHLDRELWRKAIVNAAINPVTADLGLLNGELQRDPWRGQSLHLLHEGRTAARFAGFDFSEAELEADLWRVVRATADNRSSMRQDLDLGRRTEIDAISGAILAVADLHGVDLPHTRRVVTRIHRREEERSRSSASSSGPATEQA